MTLLSITRLGDEDNRLLSSHSDDREKKCFEVLSEVVVMALREEKTERSILVNCSAGMNRSAALVCLVITAIKHIDFNDATQYLEDIRDVASRRGSVVPRGYFRSSGGVYFKALFDSSSDLWSPSKKRRYALEISKSQGPASPGLSYDMKRHPYTLEVLQSGRNTLSIGNALAACEGHFDFVLDLSGKVTNNHDTIKVAFHECVDASVVVSKLRLFKNVARRSPRDNNLLAFPDRSSLAFRRLKTLFFDKGVSTKIGRFNLRLLQSEGAGEQAAVAPNIYLIDNFLTEPELQHLERKIATSNFQPSFVDSTSEKDSGMYDAAQRNSSFVSFQHRHDSVIANIERKAATELIGWGGSPIVEPLQLVRYLGGQYFAVHHDLGDYNEDTGSVALPAKSVLAKRRLVTLFCYLNDVEAGGDTYFPGPKVMVQPKRGRAVLFSNATEDGLPDRRTIHEARPVVRGVKYGLNIWICEA